MAVELAQDWTLEGYGQLDLNKWSYHCRETKDRTLWIRGQLGWMSGHLIEERPMTTLYDDMVSLDEG